MFYEITRYFWIVATSLAIFTAGLASFIIIRKVIDEALTKRNYRRIADIDRALRDLADSIDANINGFISKVLPKARLEELAYLLDQIKKLPDMPRKKVLCKVILHSDKSEEIRKVAVSKGPRRKRILAIRILGKLRSDTLVDVLKKIIDTSSDSEAIYAAIQALGEIESPLAIDTIMSLLGTNKFSNSKIATILETLECPILNSSLKRRKDKNYIVRFWVANLLGNYKDEVAFETLQEMLKDENPNVRAAACESLGRTGNKKSIDLIHEALEDDFWFVRIHAIKALGEFLSTESISKITPFLRDRNWWVRYNAKTTLKKFGLEVTYYMQPVLKDDDRFARNSAVEILEETGSADRMFNKIISGNISDKKTYDIFIDFIKAEGFLWLKAHLKEIDQAKRNSVLNLIEKEDSSIYKDIRERAYL